MPLKQNRAVLERGGTGPAPFAGTPVAGTDEVQTVTVTGTPTGGSYILEFKGAKTAAIAHDAAASTVQTRLRALSTIGSTGVTVSGSAGGPYTVTFANEQGKKAQPLIRLFTSILSGGTNPTVTIVESTPRHGNGPRGGEGRAADRYGHRHALQQPGDHLRARLDPDGRDGHHGGHGHYGRR
jgi:hypothetical protein